MNDREPVAGDCLSILHQAAKDQRQKDAITDAFYGLSDGDTNSFAVRISVLLSACTAAMKATPEVQRQVMREEGKKLAATLEEAKAATWNAAKSVAENSKTINGLPDRVEQVLDEKLAAMEKKVDQKMGEWQRTADSMERCVNKTDRKVDGLKDFTTSAVLLGVLAAALIGMFLTLFVQHVVLRLW